MPNIPIDWASVNWLYLVLLLPFVFFCALIGNVIAFKRVLSGAVLATLLFAAGFFFWTYYPHNLPLPHFACRTENGSACPRGAVADRPRGGVTFRAAASL